VAAREQIATAEFSTTRCVRRVPMEMHQRLRGRLEFCIAASLRR
jgi:hypothetical protein